MIHESWFEAIFHLLDVYYVTIMNCIELCSAIFVSLETTSIDSPEFADASESDNMMFKTLSRLCLLLIT
jgi:hypothetical protein